MKSKITGKKLSSLYSFLKTDFSLLGSKYSIEEYYAIIRTKLDAYFHADPDQKEELIKFLNIYFKACFKELPDQFGSIELEAITDLPKVSHDEAAKKTFEGLLLENNENGDLGKFALIATASLLSGFTFLALYYIFNRFLNSMERFYYDENWFKASLTIASILAGAALGACLGFYLVGPLVMYFGFMIIGMSNPLGLAITAVVLTTILMAALTCLVTNAIQNYAIEKANPEALDPKDPARFDLSVEQAENLVKKQFNVDVVRCVIAVLREELQKLSVERLPSLFSRCISNTPRMEKINEYMELIRDLKSGNYDVNSPVVLDDLTFHLREAKMRKFELGDDKTEASDEFNSDSSCFGL